MCSCSRSSEGEFVCIACPRPPWLVPGRSVPACLWKGLLCVCVCPAPSCAPWSPPPRRAEGESLTPAHQPTTTSTPAHHPTHPPNDPPTPPHPTHTPHPQIERKREATMSTNTGIFVFTPYGKGEVLGTRNDGIVIVQLRTTQGKPYLGYFHLTQVRQLKNNEHGGTSSLFFPPTPIRVPSHPRTHASQTHRGQHDGGRQLQQQKTNHGGGRRRSDAAPARALLRQPLYGHDQPWVKGRGKVGGWKESQ